MQKAVIQIKSNKPDQVSAFLKAQATVTVKDVIITTDSHFNMTVIIEDESAELISEFVQTELLTRDDIQNTHTSFEL